MSIDYAQYVIWPMLCSWHWRFGQCYHVDLCRFGASRQHGWQPSKVHSGDFQCWTWRPHRDCPQSTRCSRTSKSNNNSKYWEKFHLVELSVLIKFHQNNQKVIYFWRFDLYQRPSSEEAGTGSFSGSWRDKLESSQESGRTYDWVGSSLRPDSWIVDLPSGYELPPWYIW